jgi:hypothetical protein
MNMVSKSRTGRSGAHEIVAATAKAERKPLPALVLVVSLCAGLGACSSTLSSMPTEVGGMPAGTPQPAAAPGAFPYVHDMPPPRNDVVLTKEEQKKAEAELMALRERQEQQGGALEKANQIIRTDQKIDTRNQ